MRKTASERGYDRLARIYAGLEYLAFGALLHQTRTALLADLPELKQILIVGEGDGRFLKAVLRRFPEASIECIEQSSKMLELAQQRLTGTEKQRTIFRQMNILKFDPPKAYYDGIFTTFILDVFEMDIQTLLLASLRLALKPKGIWYYADFHVPQTGFRKQRARLYLTVLYWFFRWQTALETRHLVDPDADLMSFGLMKQQEKSLSGNLLICRFYSLDNPDV